MKLRFWYEIKVEIEKEQRRQTAMIRFRKDAQKASCLFTPVKGGTEVSLTLLLYVVFSAFKKLFVERNVK